MTWDGNGNFTRTYGSTGWVNDLNAGTKIVASRHDTNDDDLATGINACLAKNGENAATSNLPMGTNRHTGVGAAAALTDYARADQLQNSSLSWLTGTAGADTITAAASIAPSAYAAGQSFRFVAAGTNTGAVTLNVNSLGAKSVTKNGSVALVAGDIVTGAVVTVTYDGTRFQLVATSMPWTYATGVAGTNTITTTAAVGAYAAGQVFAFIPANTNTGATTIDFGPGAKNIKTPELSALGGGELLAGAIAIVTYDGTQFQLQTRPHIVSTTAVATTSGTSVDFTGVPSWAKRLTLHMSGVSLSGTANLRVQIGTGGVPESAAYTGAESRITNSPAAAYNALGGSGFDMQNGAAARLVYGKVVLEYIGSNLWVANWMVYNDAPFVAQGVGTKTLAGTLDMVRLTTSNGADTFDAGSANIWYE